MSIVQEFFKLMKEAIVVEETQSFAEIAILYATESQRIVGGRITFGQFENLLAPSVTSFKLGWAYKARIQVSPTAMEQALMTNLLTEQICPVLPSDVAVGATWESGLLQWQDRTSVLDDQMQAPCVDVYGNLAKAFATDHERHRFFNTGIRGSKFTDLGTLRFDLNVPVNDVSNDGGIFLQFEQPISILRAVIENDILIVEVRMGPGVLVEKLTVRGKLQNQRAIDLPLCTNLQNSKWRTARYELKLSKLGTLPTQNTVEILVNYDDERRLQRQLSLPSNRLTEPVDTIPRTDLAERWKPVTPNSLRSGGQGVVTLVEASGIRGVKKRLPNNASEMHRSRLRREIEILVELGVSNCHGVPRLLESCPKREWFVTEFVSGGTLKDNLGRYSGDLDRCVVFAKAMLDTFERIHSMGIIHRDIKPPNILVRDLDKPLLIDFGIAKRLESTEITSFVGPDGTIPRPPQTQGYSPPSDFRGRDTIRHDLFMLGRVVYAVASGGREAGTPADWQIRVPLAQLNGQSFAVLDDIVERACDIEGSGFASATEMRRAFSDISNRRVAGSLVPDRSLDADATSHMKQFEFDAAIFANFDGIISEQWLSNLYYRLVADQTCETRDLTKIETFINDTELVSKQFCNEELNDHLLKFTKTLQALRNLIHQSFFVYPESQTGENVRLAMYPDLNVDRRGSGDAESHDRFVAATKDLHDRVSETENEYRVFRRAIKRQLFV